jgi:hypothetical protein
MEEFRFNMNIYTSRKERAGRGQTVSVAHSDDEKVIKTGAAGNVQTIKKGGAEAPPFSNYYSDCLMNQVFRSLECTSQATRIEDEAEVTLGDTRACRSTA